MSGVNPTGTPTDDSPAAARPEPAAPPEPVARPAADRHARFDRIASRAAWASPRAGPSFSRVPAPPGPVGRDDAREAEDARPVPTAAAPADPPADVPPGEALGAQARIAVKYAVWAGLTSPAT